MPNTTTKPKPKSKKRKGKKGDKGRTARESDRHELYELSVQEPESECDLIDQVWEEQRGRKCRSIREDFCGTAQVCMEWVKRRRKHTAVGVDLDPEVLKWARHRLPQRLTTEQMERITLIQDNVLTVPTDRVDSVCAMNFSYYLFTKRDQMRAYFARVKDALVDDGLFLMDAYGGSDSFVEMEEERELDGFTYVWDQHCYDPISGEATNFIHFRFPDGSALDRAFEYHWRVWTLPEIREILQEAGFSKTVVYWEGTEEDSDEDSDEGNGEWSVVDRGDADPGWVAYLVSMK